MHLTPPPLRLDVAGDQLPYSFLSSLSLSLSYAMKLSPCSLLHREPSPHGTAASSPLSFISLPPWPPPPSPEFVPSTARPPPLLRSKPLPHVNLLLVLKVAGMGLAKPSPVRPRRSHEVARTRPRLPPLQHSSSAETRASTVALCISLHPAPRSSPRPAGFIFPRPDPPVLVGSRRPHRQNLPWRHLLHRHEPDAASVLHSSVTNNSNSSRSPLCFTRWTAKSLLCTKAQCAPLLSVVGLSPG
ncbi:wiskott-Aldrich syndrome protein family member 1-like isoform X2 [Triticum urartu]|uniref:wiskott-Aldrich syndrome protein family member 1-like isoform X2 n=1 Tax=Triticum urartu TaxID=4572 RepID=UPI0020439F7F|nr:wiskott-Aldrich syndrome protein family member 1-like isoform X2 [Triticum urartu]